MQSCLILHSDTPLYTSIPLVCRCVTYVILSSTVYSYLIHNNASMQYCSDTIYIHTTSYFFDPQYPWRALFFRYKVTWNIADVCIYPLHTLLVTLVWIVRWTLKVNSTITFNTARTFRMFTISELDRRTKQVELLNALASVPLREQGIVYERRCVLFLFHFIEVRLWITVVSRTGATDLMLFLSFSAVTAKIALLEIRIHRSRGIFRYWMWSH